MESLAKQYGEFFQTLGPKHLKEHYGKFFDENSLFEDPFQRVFGIEQIYKVFENMYTTLYEPKFFIEEIVEQGDVAYIRWSFTYALHSKGVLQNFTGVSRVEFSKDQKVLSHIDYWDAASNVYEKIPLLGSILRFIKRKIHA